MHLFPTIYTETERQLRRRCRITVQYMREVDMNIGGKIQTLRKSRGITQMQLAAGLGVSFQAVSKWECGRSLPDIGLLPVIAECFSVSLDELFDYRPRSRYPGDAVKYCAG